LLEQFIRPETEIEEHDTLMIVMLSMTESEMLESSQRAPGIDGNVLVVAVEVSQKSLRQSPGGFVRARLAVAAYLWPRGNAAINAPGFLQTRENTENTVLLHHQDRERSSPREERLEKKLRGRVVRGEIGVCETLTPGRGRSFVRKRCHN
jgi:hypothetical protein